MKHIAVIGAGITGVTTGYSLLNRGYRVTLYDKNRLAAMETLFANGGQLSASNAEVWTLASSVLEGLRWMLRNDAPLLLNPRSSWHKYSWMAAFIRHIPDYQVNTIESVRLAIAARQHLLSWAVKENIDFDLETRGSLHMYQNRKGFEQAARVNELLAKGGLQRQAVTAEEMKSIEPTLSAELYAGYYTASDSTGDIHKYRRGLADACLRLGASFAYDSKVHALDHNGRSVIVESAREGSANTGTEIYDGVVICAGLDSRKLAAQLGDRVNVYPVKGFSITVSLPDEISQQAAPRVSLLDDDAKIVSSRLGDQRLRIAGTAELNGENDGISDSSIKPLIAWCRRHFSAVETEHAVPWAGLRPTMPNMMPRIGAGRMPGVYYNTGHGYQGWALSAATAEIIGDTIEQTMPNISTPSPRHAERQTTSSLSEAG